MAADPPESWVAEGSAIRRALVADFAALPGVQVVEPVDARYLDHPPQPADVTRIVTDRARPIDRPRLMGSVDAAVLVAPEADGTLSSLARLCESYGVTSLGSSPAAIRLCSDKAALARFFDRIGVPTPPTQTFSRAAGLPQIATESGRVVIKPVDGAGAVDTWVLAAATRDLPASWRHPTGLIQPYRPGPACSASFLVDRSGRAHLIAVGRQEITIDAAGGVRYGGGTVPIPCSDEELTPIRRAVESIPGLLGFVGVDFIRVEPTGLVEVIEINPRATTSLVGLVQLAPPGTIARAWRDCRLIVPPAAEDREIAARDQPGLEADLAWMPLREPALSAVFAPDAAFLAIRSAPPVRFRADGTVFAVPEGGG